MHRQPDSMSWIQQKFHHYLKRCKSKFITSLIGGTVYGYIIFLNAWCTVVRMLDHFQREGLIARHRHRLHFSKSSINKTLYCYLLNPAVVDKNHRCFKWLLWLSFIGPNHSGNSLLVGVNSPRPGEYSSVFLADLLLLYHQLLQSGY